MKSMDELQTENISFGAKVRRLKKPLFIGALIVVIAFGSFLVGRSTGVGVRSINITDTEQILKGDFSVFWEAIDLMKQKYVGIKDVTDQDIIYDAIRGATNATGDPYTLFFDPPDSQKFQEDIQGNFGGIGAEIGEKEGQIVVIAPLKGNPAERAGLRAGDAIVKIDETETGGMTVDEAVKHIRGEMGTPVILTIMREGWSETKEFNITRANIILPTLDWEVKNGNVGYVKLHNFNGNVPSLFYKAMVEMLSGGARGIVLDLRDNPGGFLEVSQNLAGWFLKRGSVILVERFQDGSEERLRTDGNAALADVPVVILVNEGSASASEILAGALRDTRGIQLIGKKTYGKGSVQEVLDLSDGSSLKVTVAEWFTPKGTRINKVGLSPDIEVGLTDADAESGKDPQLAKALEVIGQKMVNGN
jgi:carboxyl-terminal processing protease